MAAKWITLFAVYGLIFLMAWWDKRHLDAAEKKTFRAFWLFWSVTIFLVNYGGYRLGLFSFLPWANNFVHTFVWIGVVLTYLYLAVRRQHIVTQVMAFGLFSLAVRYTEYNLFGVWDKDHFLGVFQGTDGYIFALSFFDGFYPIGAFWVLGLMRKKIGGLIPAGV